MANIHLRNIIHAPIERVFDLSRSIDLHIISTKRSDEKAVDGVTSGLIGLDQTVTWQAFHLFRRRYFTSKITGFRSPVYFKDEMQEGDFKRFSHEHFFESSGENTIMSDTVIIESPYGIIGKIVTRLYLKNYITKLLKERNNVIKEYAETDKWKIILTEKNG